MAAGNPTRTRQAERTRSAIAAAALDIFVEKGFASARMEDVARQANVAKGTIYLHFTNKEALFEAILAETILPAVDGLAATEPGPDESTRALAERLLIAAVARLQAGSGAAVLRLLMAEGPRFPDLAAIYYSRVVEPGLAVLRRLGERAVERGESGGEALVRFPQLAIAPVLMGLLWEALFERFDPLDVGSLLRAHLDLLFSAPPSDID